MRQNGPVRVAFVGCGNIVGSYADSMQRSPDRLELVGAFDQRADAARKFVEKYGGRQYDSLDELLADDTIELAVNLTSHMAHGEVTQRLLAAGKNVHSEKPLATSREEGRACVELAVQKNLLLSCSPFVILGEAQQVLLRCVREGMVGEVREIYAEMNHGRIESYHPAPEGFYGKGAGPLLDAGCYPLHVLTQIFGSVRFVRAMAGVCLEKRTIDSGPNAGKTFTVTNPDHIVVLMEFVNGIRSRLTTSFFTVKSVQTGIEIHGTKGSLYMSSSFSFDADLRICMAGEKEWRDVLLEYEPYPGIEWARGLLDVSTAIRDGTPLTCPGTFAYHVLDICLSALEAAETGQTVRVESTLTERYHGEI